MKYLAFIVVLFYLFVVFNNGYHINQVSCDTLFVLESAESPPSVPSQLHQSSRNTARNNQQQVDKDDNDDATKVITDEGSSSSQSQATIVSSKPSNIPKQHYSTTQAPQARTNQDSEARRHRDESGQRNQHKQPQPSSTVVKILPDQPPSKPTRITTTTTQVPPSLPPSKKEEDRIFSISITSQEDEDEDNKNVESPNQQKLTPIQDGSSSSAPKRNNSKQKFVIQIQNKDGNPNGPLPQFVVRPSQDGIVLSLNEGIQINNPVIQSSSNNNNNKQQQQQNNNLNPSSNNDYNSNNSPIQQSYQFKPPSTTYRPSLHLDDHGNSLENPSRPISSMLVETPTLRPPINQPYDSNPRPSKLTPSFLHTSKPNHVNQNDNNEDTHGSSYEERPLPPMNLPSSRPQYPNQEQPGINHPLQPSPQQPPSQLQSQLSDNARPSSPLVIPNEQQQLSKYPMNEGNCGTLKGTRIVGGTEANPEDYQWMVAIIKSKPKEAEVRPFCGGTLITRRHILTAAHCLENLAPRDILVRIGSYDFDDETASSNSADYAIDQFRVPAEYSKKTHVGDIAIMRLKQPLSQDNIYRTICMPQARRFYVGIRATVIGYGSQSHTFRKQAAKLRQVDVPIWDNKKCSAVYKKQLNESFLCAGEEEGGRDACQGDSGGPLMVDGPTSDARMVIAGVVSHGIGCGGTYPGVYTRVSTYMEWIEKNTRE